MIRALIGLILASTVSCFSPNEIRLTKESEFWLNHNHDQIKNLVSLKDRLVKNAGFFLISQDIIDDLEKLHVAMVLTIATGTNQTSLRRFWTHLKTIEQKVLENKVSTEEGYAIRRQGELNGSLLDLIEYEANVIEMVRNEMWVQVLFTLERNTMIFSIPESHNVSSDSVIFYLGAIQVAPISPNGHIEHGRILSNERGIMRIKVSNKDLRQAKVQVDALFPRLYDQGILQEGVILKREFSLTKSPLNP